MTISELIEKLDELPDGTKEVFIQGDLELIAIEEVTIDEDGDVILS